MSGINIVSAEEFDISKITATEPKKKNDRLQNILLYDNAPFFVETEWGRSPFGVRSFDGGEKTNYSLNISLTPDGQFVENLRQLDEFMIDFGIEHSKMIFKQKYSAAQREVVRAMYTSLVKQSEEGDYPPRIAPKIQKKSVDNPAPNVLFYHSETEEVEIDDFQQLEKLVPKGAKVKALVSLRPWYISGRFGVSMTVQQLLVPKLSTGRPTTYAFNDKTGAVSTKVSAKEAVEAVEDNEEEQEEEVEQGTDVESVEDSDVVAAEEEEAEEEAEEEEEEDEEEEEPEPVPKKVVKKAAAAPAASRKRTTSRK
jgi:hypothetical protein